MPRPRRRLSRTSSSRRPHFPALPSTLPSQTTRSHRPHRSSALPERRLPLRRRTSSPGSELPICMFTSDSAGARALISRYAASRLIVPAFVVQHGGGRQLARQRFGVDASQRAERFWRLAAVELDVEIRGRARQGARLSGIVCGSNPGASIVSRHSPERTTTKTKRPRSSVAVVSVTGAALLTVPPVSARTVAPRMVEPVSSRTTPPMRFCAEGRSRHVRAMAAASAYFGRGIGRSISQSRVDGR